jgi:HEAT repeat protein
MTNQARSRAIQMDQMPTPTSPETHPNQQPKVTLAEAIDAIGRGTFKERELAPLSDLSRQDAATLAASWPSFPEATRERLVRELDELAEAKVEYIFGRALRIALDDPSPVVRQLAIAALWEDEGSDLPDRFLRLTDTDPSDDVRAEAAQALGKFAELCAEGELDDELHDRLRSTLLNYAGDAREPFIVRRRCLESVAPLGNDPEVRQLIEDAYDEDDDGLRVAAIYAMGKSLDSRWLSSVMMELDNPDAEIRFEAARAAGLLGSDKAVEPLLELLTDTDTEVRHAAIGALGEIGSQGAINALRRLAKTAGEADSEAVANALETASIGVDALRLAR